MGNQQPVFNRLEVPSFDLTWLTTNDTTGEAVVLIPGGSIEMVIYLSRIKFEIDLKYIDVCI